MGDIQANHISIDIQQRAATLVWSEHRIVLLNVLESGGAGVNVSLHFHFGWIEQRVLKIHHAWLFTTNFAAGNRGTSSCDARRTWEMPVSVMDWARTST